MKTAIFILSLFISNVLFSQRFEYKIITFNEEPNAFTVEQLKSVNIQLRGYINKKTYKIQLPIQQGITSHDFMISDLELKHKMAQIHQSELLSDEESFAFVNLTLESFDVLSCRELLDYFTKDSTIVVLNSSISRKRIDVLIPQNQIITVAAKKEVEFAFPTPLIYKNDTPHDRPSTGRANWLNSSITGLNYDGLGVTVAVREGKKIGNDNPDFNLRQLNDFEQGPQGGHKTGVASHLCGAGNKNPRNIGIAPGANFYDIPVSVGPSFNSLYNDNDVRYINQSYGSAIGTSFYTNDSKNRDNNMYLNDKMIFVHSAGNENANTGNYNYGPYMVDVGNMAKITSDEKIAKNNILCQSVNVYDNAYIDGSNGPAYDGRIKPDLTAEGEFGTSHAAPKVVGALAQLNQVAVDLFGVEPDNALLKSILFNSADDHGRKGPDFRYGFGKMNVRRAFNTLVSQDVFTGTSTLNDTDLFEINVPANAVEVKVTLVWTDPPANASPTPDTALVNNLDLFTKSGSTIIRPWVLNTFPHEDSLKLDATRGTDFLNNVEQVSFKVTPSLVDILKIYVVGKSFKDITYPNQKYYIAYEIVEKETQIVYPLGNEKFVPGEEEVIRWDAYGVDGDFIIELKEVGQSVWNEIATVDNDKRMYNLLIPDDPSFYFKEYEIRITDVDEALNTSSSAPFTVAPLVDNLNYVGSCAGVAYFNWDNTISAMTYHLHYLDGKYMSDQNTDYFTNYGSSSQPTPWYAVSAVANGLESRRSNAIKVLVQFNNCDYVDSVITSIDPPANLVELSNRIEIFPNPAQDFVQISSSADAIGQILITDINGKLVYQKATNKENELIDVSDFAPGAYLVKAFSLSGLERHQKFIKQ
jgi:hypothetical protein